MLRQDVLIFGLCLALAGAVACGGGSTGAPAPPVTPYSTVDAATAGTVTGTVSLDGVAPENVPFRMNADPVCMKLNTGTQTLETYVVGSNGRSLGNVLVYVKDRFDNYVFDAPTEPVAFDQKDCRFVPHVFALQAGQPLEIHNSDATMHNIHALPKENKEFNTGQPIQGMTTIHRFTKQEIAVPVKCDVHGWMSAFVNIFDHPYFSVTKDDGTFALKSLPPGTYTIEAWHEKFGVATQSVTIGAKETKDIAFTFKLAGLSS